MKVYIVRHTSVVLDGNHVCYGFSDIDVRPTFREEATLTRQALEGLSFDGVFSSPLRRARKLATFCGYPDPIVDDRLKEMNFGEWEGKLWSDIIIDQGTQEFFLRYIDHPTPGGESLRMQYDRVRSFLMEKQAAGYQEVLIFCHGGVINCARTLAGLCQLEDAYATIPPFGSVTELDFSFLQV
ncbi:histidine phosphatase family protein [Porphyromonas catoniae]|jgi:phosphoglycerate mutase family protein|uniref:histidine phosphatase family protein n=1 Tax=Porphyromonas catoniae TaxID=41976 RepID=UPI0028D2FDEE|nr:histidine phosphatase family protein [Porphyromonas catoniae]